MKNQIKKAIKEQFGTQRKFCSHAGLNEKDFPAKLSSFDKSIKRLNKLLIHLGLELGLKEIQKCSDITINYKGVDLDIEFEIEPIEEEYFNFKEGYGSPQCGGETTLYEIKINGVCVWELTEDYHDDIIDLIHEKLDEDGRY